MSAEKIRIITEGFRAINKANLVIDGITVVAGENGSGKSSISKLLYFLYKTVANYNFLVKGRLIEQLKDVSHMLDILQREMIFLIKDKGLIEEIRNDLKELNVTLYKRISLDSSLVIWLRVLNSLEVRFKELNIDHHEEMDNSNRLNRLKFIIKDVLNEDNLDFNTSESFAKIKELVIARFKEASGLVNSRPTSIFIDELKNIFSDSSLPEKFEVLEFGDAIVSLTKDHLAIPYTIQNAIYIDTPMMLSVEYSHNVHWDDLNHLLEKKGSHKNKLTDLISSDITQGEIIVEAEDFKTGDFKFKRRDGAVFNLSDVATGIKSFSIIQQLLNLGQLNDKTLLIIDEPESHLHPQWIIEYARVIVLLNKEYGVKFFIASHNPDMVSAIRYISEKEGVLKDVNFYLAERNKDAYTYNYKELGTNIDPIFESFNIAIDRVNQYGI